MKLLAVLLLASCSSYARINITTVAAGTTIAVNVLEYKDRVAKIRKIAKATKKAVTRNSGKGTLVPTGKAK